MSATKRTIDPEENPRNLKKHKPLVGEARAIPEAWLPHIKYVTASPEWDELCTKVKLADYYPRGENIYQALKDVDPKDVKVVIVGQDPYHGPGQATGRAFAVPRTCKIPPSLRNIIKQVQSEYDGVCPRDLELWAKQGVLLLNSTLTVAPGEAGSHSKWGWDDLTNAVIDHLAETRRGLVFMLWGAHAKKKGSRIDKEKHLVIETVHPSPLSASKGFFDRAQFTEANAYLGERAIQWTRPVRFSDVANPAIQKPGSKPLREALIKYLTTHRWYYANLRKLARVAPDRLMYHLLKEVPLGSAHDVEELCECLIAKQRMMAMKAMVERKKTDYEALAHMAEDMGFLDLATDLNSMK